MPHRLVTVGYARRVGTQPRQHATQRAEVTIPEVYTASSSQSVTSISWVSTTGGGFGGGFITRH